MKFFAPSFIGVGWWILKASNDPSSLSLIKHLSVETRGHNRHRSWLQPGVVLQYDDEHETSYSRGTHISQTIVDDGKRMVILLKEPGTYYVYRKLEYSHSSILQVQWFCIVLLQLLLLYRQTEWLSLLWTSQNHI